jgi:hypothetical protein
VPPTLLGFVIVPIQLFITWQGAHEVQPVRPGR